MVGGVVAQVATLAPATQVVGGAVRRVVIQVGDGQDDLAVGDRVRFAVPGAAFGIGRTALAAIPGSLANRGADRFPVFRIAGPVFDGHRYAPRA